MLSRAGHLVETKLDVHRLRRLDAAAQQSDKAVLFLDRLEQIAQLLLIRETDRGGHLRGAFDVNSALGAVAQNLGIAQNQGVVCNATVLLTVSLNLQTKVGAHGFERPSNVMTV